MWTVISGMVCGQKSVDWNRICVECGVRTLVETDVWTVDWSLTLDTSTFWPTHLGNHYTGLLSISVHLYGIYGYKSSYQDN